MMNFASWYTDTVDIYRNTSSKTGNLTRNERTPVQTGVPCRIYQSDNQPVTMTQTAAYVNQADKLMLDNGVEILPGDELIIHRGALLGKEVATIRAFAADANHYFEPFGAVVPGLAHQEIRLKQQERI